ncbi:MAG TPA: hypothetical protein VKR99_02615 [Candidatus Eremiobacteraceae bacterium]|nr:hypothetical protein [Candidatus Eremiobacteraceae bacterium]
MVIQLCGVESSDALAPIPQLVEKRYGKEIRLGNRLIGWNLNDTIVVRSEGLTPSQLSKFVRHFATQRHVIFESLSPPKNIGPYVSLARELRDYLFAFVDSPLAEHLRAVERLKEQFQNAPCKVVTLRPARSVPQLEVLLLSAKPVLRSYEPLVLPAAAIRRTTSSAPRKTQKAA